MEHDLQASSTDDIFWQNEGYLASAVNYLIEGEQFTEAGMLASCTLTTSLDSNSYGEDMTVAELTGPRSVYDILEARNPSAEARAINRALDAAFGRSVWVRGLAASVSPDENWREQALEVVKGKTVNNQALGGDSPIIMYERLRFRSVSEVRIARELDRRGISYFPGPVGRVHYNGKIANLEPDFIIIHDGRTGILEVDGDQFHPANAAAKEHGRDRAFRSKNIIVERFPASRCFNEPMKVVDEFLAVFGRA